MFWNVCITSMHDRPNDESEQADDGQKEPVHTTGR